MRIRLGRHVFGLAALAVAACALRSHQFNIWEPTQPLAHTPYRELPVYAALAAEIFGGLAIQWRKSAQAGALALFAIYLVFALLSVPAIVREPLVYNAWGDMFEQLSLAASALVVDAGFARSDAAWKRRASRVGYFCFAICVVSFALEQAVYLGVTASFVPKWIPPSPKFWAIATTVAFALAAMALLIRRQAALAAILLTTMLVLFGLLIWLPAAFVDPHDPVVVAGNTENFAVVGAAWIIADMLNPRRLGTST